MASVVGGGFRCLGDVFTCMEFAIDGVGGAVLCGMVGGIWLVGYGYGLLGQGQGQWSCLLLNKLCITSECIEESARGRSDKYAPLNAMKGVSEGRSD